MINRLQTIFIGLLALFFGILNSCNSQSDNLLSIGNNFIDPSTRLTKVDTFGISLSTIIMDSLITSSSETALVGSYFDDSTGNVSSKSYFQIGLPDGYNIKTGDIYDSVALVLRHSSYYMGDTNQVFSLSVHRVIEDMEVNDDGYLYNTSSFDYDYISLGSINYCPYPDRDDEVLINLDDVLGFDLFDKLKNGADEVYSTSDFVDYFKGLLLIPDDNINNAMIGFGMVDSLLSLRLYYHRVEEELIEFETDFPVINNSLRFNQITSNKSNTSLENLVEQRYAMHSSLTGDATYVKGGTGLMTTISFPWLKSLIEINDGSLFRAELVLHPIISGENIDFIPENFLLYEGGKYNTIEGTYADASGSPYYGTVLKDELTNEATITFDITDYIQEEIADSYYDTERMFILSYDSPEYNASINWVAVGGFENKKYQPKLNIYYIHYETY